MCLFPRWNSNTTDKAYKKGVTSFECGACPECLSKRSNIWALRCSMESKTSNAIMVTLTYDTYKYDKNGNIIGENVSNRKVDKKDCQKFIKRLRVYMERKQKSDKKVSYLLSAEYGTRTHRPHYHAILFNVKFDDIRYYKKSKRGNVIYKSHTLTKIWNNGICTIDSLVSSAAIAKYCTKYTAKSRSADTFTLCSRKIGLEEMLKRFNGKSYFVDGREYPIPKFVWNHVIEDKYCAYGYSKYYNKPKDNEDNYEYKYKQYNIFTRKRTFFNDRLKGKDKEYIEYLKYWKHKGEYFDSIKKPILQRIVALDERKYHMYKVKALVCYRNRFVREFPMLPPGSNCGSSDIYKYFMQYGIRLEKKEKCKPFLYEIDSEIIDTLNCPQGW